MLGDFTLFNSASSVAITSIAPLWAYIHWLNVSHAQLMFKIPRETCTTVPLYITVQRNNTTEVVEPANAVLLTYLDTKHCLGYNTWIKLVMTSD